MNEDQFIRLAFELYQKIDGLSGIAFNEFCKQNGDKKPSDLLQLWTWNGGVKYKIAKNLLGAILDLFCMDEEKKKL